jgi:RNA polymerase sigma-70 factor (ECF subfamily)
MSDDVDFVDFLARVRAGDEQAAAELIRRYESIICREVRLRLRLRNPGLNRLMDSVDICQSVLKSFFVRAAWGQYDLKEPGQLLHLLIGMARNKLAFAARKHQAQRRDHRRVASLGQEALDVAGGQATPSRIAAGKELLASVRERLGDDERRLADLRAQGWEWAAIARELGGTPDARRVQLTRALDRVVEQLGLERDHE